jgi:hypothetical protein
VGIQPTAVNALARLPGRVTTPMLMALACVDPGIGPAGRYTHCKKKKEVGRG